jgi:putative two-component system response regulator
MTQTLEELGQPHNRLHDMRIIVVDDEPANLTLLTSLLKRWHFNDVVAINDPTQVVETFTQQVPDLLLLDLNMPGLSGFDVMRLLTPWTEGSTPVPVVMLTADTTRSSKHEGLTLGARDFLTKPFDPEEVRLRVGNLLEMRRLQIELKAHSEQLEERVQLRTHQLEQARLEVVERLALAAEYRDDDTHQHARRIGRTTALLAADLGLPRLAVERIYRAAPLHDIGKIAIPDSILLKPGKLTAEEFDTVKTHTILGARILTGSQSELLRTAEEIALSHHERWEGTGYPHGLRGDEIPLAGRLVAVADVFDALTHRRPYKPAWPLDDAVNEILDQRGRHFDPEIVDVFQELDHNSLLSVEPTVNPSGTHNGTSRSTAGALNENP